MDQGSDPACGDAYVYALREETAYLQTDEDQKPEIIAEPPPDPTWFKCSFCRKTDRRRLFGAEYLVRDPNTFAVIAQICICSDCVAKFAERLAQESPEAPSDTVVDGTDRPCRARPADPVPGRGGPRVAHDGDAYVERRTAPTSPRRCVRQRRCMSTAGALGFAAWPCPQPIAGARGRTDRLATALAVRSSVDGSTCW